MPSWRSAAMGLMLQTLHKHLHGGVPIYGMNRGSFGFLMNDYSEDDLIGRLARPS
jgi:NAD+ kinase